MPEGAAAHPGTRALIIAAVLMNVVGNFALGRGMHQVGHLVSASPVPYLRAFLNPWVGGGVILLAAWMICQLSLLSRADLSYVMPVTASAYVFTAILGRVFLDEPVSPSHWLGMFAITAGVVVVGRTTPHTTGPAAAVHPPAIVYPLEEADEVVTGPADRSV